MDGSLINLLDIILLAFLVITALAVVLIRNLLVSVILLGIFSLLMAAMYIVMGAPDVAITEAAIGAGISTLLLLAVLLLTGEQEKPSKHPLLPIILMGITGAALFLAVSSLPAFGDGTSAAATHVIPYYLSESSEEIGIPNVVTSILASYRGFDTMGEVFVVFTAGISVFMLLGKDDH